MRINRFELVNGHGYLNVRIDFFPDLTFLTGINGSGKTTVVRGLVALLSPSFTELANTKFSRMEVAIELNGQPFTISATRNETDFEIVVSSIPSPLTIPIFKQGEFEREPHFRERESDYYRETHTSLAKHPVLDFLNQLPTPMFLDLERRAQGPITKRRFLPYEQRPRQYGPQANESLGPGLSVALELADEEFRKIQSNQSRLVDRLRTGLILTAFAPLPEEGDVNAADLSEIDESQLREQEAVVLTSLRELGIPQQSLIDTVGRFFAQIVDLFHKISGRDIQQLLKSEDGVALFTQWYSVQPQIRQINRIVRLVERYNENLAKTRHSLRRYLDTVNGFMLESGKRFDFTPRGRLKVFIENKELSGLAGLSSGERQLFVILTHLAFNERARAANVLIIDEPELSLHVRWQEMFVRAMQETGEDLQLILATHSPSIILDRIDRCVDVSGLRE
jgi:predicted ATP-binding protein involved in virulence